VFVILYVNLKGREFIQNFTQNVFTDR